MAVDQLHHSNSSQVPPWQTLSMSWFTHALTEENTVSQHVLFPAPVTIYVAGQRSEHDTSTTQGSTWVRKTNIEVMGLPLRSAVVAECLDEKI